MRTNHDLGPPATARLTRAFGHLLASLRVLEGLTRRLDQFGCGLAGHDELMRFEPKRLSLRCTRCGHQTEGWDMTCPRPRRLLPV